MDGHCVEKSQHLNITANEHKRKLTINNPLKRVIRKITVDKCLIPETSSEKRCDFMFEVDEPITQVIYLELKGRHIEHAIKQLTATLNKYKVEHKDYKKECHIVASRIPKAGPEVQQLKIKMLKNQKATLTVSTKQAVITV